MAVKIPKSGFGGPIVRKGMDMDMDNFIQWLNEFRQPEILWFIIGFVLIIAEFVMPGFIIIYFGFGAIFTAICCLLINMSVNAQIVLFIVFSVVSLVLTRSFLKKIFIGDDSSEDNAVEGESEYVGHEAVTIGDIEAGGEGKIEFQGSDWQAKSDKAIEKGCRVVIIGHNNLMMTIERKK